MPADHLTTDGSEDDRIEQAVAVADELLRTAQSTIDRSERRRQHRLGNIVADPAGKQFVQRLTDEVLRLERSGAAARRFGAIVGQGVPDSFGRLDRWLLKSGATAARALPFAVMPLVKRRVVAETHGLVIPAQDPDLARHIRLRTGAGMKLNLNVLGEAILSDAEAEQRIERVITALQRPDVDYVSVKISAVCALLDVFAFDHSVDRICVALRRIFDAAAATTPPTFVNLDMEEYADLDLTVAAFTRVLDEATYRSFRAGIVLQAYLPDSHGALERLGDWAAARVVTGGAPIKVRIVKGANLAMERVDAELHGWVPAPYPAKADADASYKRLLDRALQPEWAGAVRVGVASHNIFDLAWALLLRTDLPEARRADMEFEMLEGMVPAQTRAVEDAAGGMLLYCPIVRDDEIEASLAYLARRLDENTSPENFLRAVFTMTPGSPEFMEQADRFRVAVAARHTVSTAPRRPAPDPEIAAALAAGSFANEPDADLTSSDIRAAVMEAIAQQALGSDRAGPHPFIDDVIGIDEVVAMAAGAAPPWAARSTRERSQLLWAAAASMAGERPTTLALMADEAAKTVREGDAEVSEAIDFARYYAAGAEALEAAGDFERSEPIGVVVVASPWNFPYAIPAGGVFAALAAGNSVVLKPPPETGRVAWHLAEQCWRAGIPRDVLQYVACPDDEVGRRLVTHPDVGTVVLTGAHGTAMQFLDWKPDLRLVAETSGKNAIVVTEAADMDAAIRDIVRSAFGHAGQKCSAASLAILTAPVHDDSAFRSRLAAAVRSIRVGEPDDPATIMGPLIAPPTGPLLRALTTLESGEAWLVEPRERHGSRRGERPDELTSRRWTPGVRLGVVEGSWFHQTECFGPVLGIMRADDLDHALRLQNGTPFGLTGGIQSLDDAEVRRWLDGVQVGNAYVNRHITGAVVQRQPFGGWKRSSVGGAPKAGGPHYVTAFRRPVSVQVDAEAAATAYDIAFGERYAGEHDASGLESESNRLRHVPLRHVVVRIGADTPEGAVAAARAAASVCGVTVTVSDAAHEDDADLAARLASLDVDRLRLLTDAGETLRRAAHVHDVAVDEAPVSASPDLELPHWFHEQAISETMHRYGLLR